MFTRIRTAALSALLGVGVLAAASASAQADTLGYGAGHRSAPGIGIEVRFDGGPGYRRHHRRPPVHRAVCTPQRAVAKARDMGIRRAHVRDVSRRAIRVAGFSRGHRVSVVFARAPFCPIIR